MDIMALEDRWVLKAVHESGDAGAIFFVFDLPEFKYHSALTWCQLLELLCNHNTGRKLMLAVIVNIVCSCVLKVY